MYHHLTTMPHSLPDRAPMMTSQPRVRRRRRRHVPHADRPVEAVDRRNARERRRVNDVNAAFLHLQVHLPSCKNDDDASPKSDKFNISSSQKRISKIKILHDAIDYIAQLTSILNLSAYSTVLGGLSPASGGGYVDLLQDRGFGQQAYGVTGSEGEQEMDCSRVANYEGEESNQDNSASLKVRDGFKNDYRYHRHHWLNQDHSSYLHLQPLQTLTPSTPCGPPGPSYLTDWPTCYLNLDNAVNVNEH